MNHTALVPIRHLVATSWSELSLDPRHEAELKDSGIAPEVAADRGVRSIHKASELPAAFTGSQRRVPGYLLPMYGFDGEITNHQYKPDDPRRVGEPGKPSKPIKYENPKGSRMLPDVPPSMRAALFDVAVPLVFTEGIKKGDSAASVGMCAVSIGGVWNFSPAHARAELEKIPVAGRRVFLVFDGDAQTNENVRRALQALAVWLTGRGAVVSVVVLPDIDDLAKTGLDDWLANRAATGEPNDPESVTAALEALTVPLVKFAVASEPVKTARPTDRQTVIANLSSQEGREAFDRIVCDLEAERDAARDALDRLRAVKAADDQRNGAVFKTYRNPKMTPAARSALAVVTYLNNVPVKTWRSMPNKLTADLAGKSVNVVMQHWAAIAPALVGIVETEKQWSPTYQQPTIRRRLLVPVEAAIAAIVAYADRAMPNPTATTAPDLSWPVVIHTDRRTYRAEVDGGELIAETHTRRRTTRPRPAAVAAPDLVPGVTHIDHRNGDLYGDDQTPPPTPAPVVVLPIPIGHQNSDLYRDGGRTRTHRLPDERLADATAEHRGWQAAHTLSPITLPAAFTGHGPGSLDGEALALATPMMGLPVAVGEAPAEQDATHPEVEPEPAEPSSVHPEAEPRSPRRSPLAHIVSTRTLDEQERDAAALERFRDDLAAYDQARPTRTRVGGWDSDGQGEPGCDRWTR